MAVLLRGGMHPHAAVSPAERRPGAPGRGGADPAGGAIRARSSPSHQACPARRRLRHAAYHVQRPVVPPPSGRSAEVAPAESPPR